MGAIAAVTTVVGPNIERNDLEQIIQHSRKAGLLPSFFAFVQDG